MPPYIVLLGLIVAGLPGCAEPRRVLTAPAVTDEEWRLRAEFYAHQTPEQRQELLQRVAADLPGGSPPRVEVLLRLVDLRLEQARSLAGGTPESDEPGVCAPERALPPTDGARAAYEGALSVIALLRAEVPLESDERAEVEWRAALASRGLALIGETREALLAVIKGHPDSPLVQDALFALGDWLWVTGGDEYKMYEAYRRASEAEEFHARAYALLQLGRCAIGYGDTEGARRAFSAAAVAKRSPNPANWRCDDVGRAAADELDRIDSDPPSGH